MKRAMWMLAAVAMTALAGCGKKDGDSARAPEAADAARPASTKLAEMKMPVRKPGLWVQTINAAGRAQTTSICFDAAMDKKMAVWGQQAGKDMCQQTSITPIMGGWKFSSTCDMGTSGTIVSQGETKGDFNSHYEVKSTSTTTGAAVAQMNGTHEISVVADWKGPCPADMTAGDMILPGGMKMNMLALADSAQSGKPPSAEAMAAMRKQMEAAAKADR